MEESTLLELVQKLVASNEEIKKQIKENQVVLKTEFRSLKEELFTEISKIKSENQELKQQVNILKEKLTKIERESKKYSFIVYNFEETEDEVSDLQNFLNLIRDKVGVDCNFGDIRNFYRIGKPSTQKFRPISVEVVSSLKRKEIFQKAKNLKGTKVSVTPDYTAEEYGEQKFLYNHLKIARTSGKEAYIKKRALFIEGKRYTVEDLKSNTTESIKIPDSENRTRIVSQSNQRALKGKPSLRETYTEDLLPRKFLRSNSGGSSGGGKH